MTTPLWFGLQCTRAHKLRCALGSESGCCRRSHRRHDGEINCGDLHDRVRGSRCEVNHCAVPSADMVECTRRPMNPSDGGDESTCGTSSRYRRSARLDHAATGVLPGKLQRGRRDTGVPYSLAPGRNWFANDLLRGVASINRQPGRDGPPMERSEGPCCITPHAALSAEAGHSDAGAVECSWRDRRSENVRAETTTQSHHPSSSSTVGRPSGCLSRGLLRTRTRAK